MPQHRLGFIPHETMCTAAQPRFNLSPKVRASAIVRLITTRVLLATGAVVLPPANALFETGATVAQQGDAAPGNCPFGNPSHQLHQTMKRAGAGAAWTSPHSSEFVGCPIHAEMVGPRRFSTYSEVPARSTGPAKVPVRRLRFVWPLRPRSRNSFSIFVLPYCCSPAHSCLFAFFPC